MRTIVILCFFFNDTATTEIYTLSLHDALPISKVEAEVGEMAIMGTMNNPGTVLLEVADLSKMLLVARVDESSIANVKVRSEEHTSELQSRQYLVCRLLLEKKKIQCHHSSISHI